MAAEAQASGPAPPSPDGGGDRRASPRRPTWLRPAAGGGGGERGEERPGARSCGAQGRGRPSPATAALASCISAPLPRSAAHAHPAAAPGGSRRDAAAHARPARLPPSLPPPVPTLRHSLGGLGVLGPPRLQPLPFPRRLHAPLRSPSVSSSDPSGRQSHAGCSAKAEPSAKPLPQGFYISVFAGHLHFWSPIAS